MLSIRSILASLLALSPLDLAHDFPPPDRNSTTIAGAIQHAGQGESLVNVTGHFSVPTLHLRYNQPSPQGITIFTEVDPEDCKASFKFGINSIIYANQTQYHEFFYHWSGSPAQSYIMDFPLDPGDEINLTIEPSVATVRVTLSNLSKQNAKVIPISNTNRLCLTNFGFVIQDPSLVKDDNPVPDTSSRSPVTLAEFNAVSWIYAGGVVSGGKEYGISDAEMVYMTTKGGDKYKAAALDTGSTGGHSSLVFFSQAEDAQDQGEGKDKGKGPNGKGEGDCGQTGRHAWGCGVEK